MFESIPFFPSACPVCGSTKASFYSSLGGFRMDRCAQCRFVFVNPRPDSEGVSRFYSDPLLNVFGSDAYEPFEYEREGIAKLVAFLGREAPGTRLLEVGCGRGDFLRVAREAGFSVSGCDFFSGVKPQIENATLHDGPLHAAHLPAESLDVVVLRLTLEHLLAPLEDLAEIRRVLKPGGLLYVKVPNLHFEHGLGGRLLHGAGHAFGTPYHLNHFTPATLNRLLAQAGFSALKNFVEQPSRRSSFRSDLPRQALYRLQKLMHAVTFGRFYPMIVLSGVARKRRD
jgi:SAM-dependent methyltransferase